MTVLPIVISEGLAHRGDVTVDEFVDLAAYGLGADMERQAKSAMPQ